MEGGFERGATAGRRPLPERVGWSPQSGPEEDGARRAERALRGPDWLAAHPTLTGMISLDVADSSCVHAAFLVYLDLLEARNWHEVSYVGLAEFQLVCLCGREREAEGLQVVVPTPVHVSISHESAGADGLTLPQALKYVSLQTESITYQLGDAVAQNGIKELGLSLHIPTGPIRNECLNMATVELLEKHRAGSLSYLLTSWLRQIMKKLYTLKDEPDSLLSITLAIVESDSTIVYYKLTDGFVTPDPPDDTEDMDDKQWSKKRKRFMRR